MAKAAESEVDPETLSIIRGMLAEQTDAPAPPAASDPGPAEFVERRRTPQPHLEAAALTAEPARRAVRPRLPQLRLPDLRGLAMRRPSRRAVIAAVLLGLVIFRPAWVIAAVVVTSLAALALFLFLGTDRIWSLIVAGLRRRMARDPARAAQIAARIDRFADRWDRVLDIFPEGTVDALYFPDLQGLMEADARHDAALAARLARMRQEA